MLRAMKEKTATTVNMMVGMSITTAEPTFVPKKEMVAIQPLQEEASYEAAQHGEGYPGAIPLDTRIRDHLTVTWKGHITGCKGTILLIPKGPMSVVQEEPSSWLRR